MAAKKKPNTAPEDKKPDSATDNQTENQQATPEQAAPEQTGATNPPATEAGLGEEKYLRLVAEYDNFRKRSAKERENIYADVRVDTITRFLPVYDNLERAMSTQTADEAYKKGVEMTFSQLTEVFKKLGVEEIEALGQTFDPTLHNAVMHVDDEQMGENVIVAEFQKGFRLGDRVIRHSMVKVAN